MKNLFAVLSLVLAFGVVANAQQFRFNVSALNKEQYRPEALNPKNIVEYAQAVSAEVEARAVQAGEFSFAGVGTYQRDFSNDLNTVLVGARLRYKKSFFSPFASFHVGYESADGLEKEFCREIQFGADLDFGRFTVRPLAYGQKRKGALLSPAENRFYSGIGINIK